VKPGYEPTTLRCGECGHELHTPARLLAERDRECPMCEGGMVAVQRPYVTARAVSPWD
jgi:Zn finger protein HypA/HybF involved in hydrogenase expression